MTDRVGYEPGDILAAVAGVSATADAMTAADTVEALVAICDAIGALNALRVRLGASLADAARSAPRSGLVVPTAAGTVTVTVTTPLARRKVRHDKLRSALDVLADRAENRVDAVTGEDLGRAAARLKMWDRCYSMSPRWAEIAHLGLRPGDYCDEAASARVVVDGDGIEAPITLPAAP